METQMGFSFFMGYFLGYLTSLWVICRQMLKLYLGDGNTNLRRFCYFLQETRFCIFLKNVVLGMISEWIMFGLDFDFLDEGRCQETAMKTQENRV